MKLRRAEKARRLAEVVRRREEVLRRKIVTKVNESKRLKCLFTTDGNEEARELLRLCRDNVVVNRGTALGFIRKGVYELFDPRTCKWLPNYRYEGAVLIEEHGMRAFVVSRE